MKPIFKCDVDECIVDSADAWLDWISHMIGRDVTVDDHKHAYNLGKIFADEMKHLRVDPMDFWRQSGLYDTLTPVVDSVEALERIKAMGYEIVFVSHVKGHHSKSKHNFLRRYFGHIMDGYVVTKEKRYVSSGTGFDAVIDDRYDYLTGNEEVKFLIKTPWSQFIERPEGIIEVKSWTEVPDLLKANSAYRG